MASGLVKQRGESYLHLEEEGGFTVRTFTAGPVLASGATEEGTERATEGAEVDSELCRALAS